MNRVITYIDGFNLYFGLKSKGWKDFYWLNLKFLSENLLKPGQSLVFTKYFTARVQIPEDKRKRQITFLEALGTLNDFEIHYGKYQVNPYRCIRCGAEYGIPSEKMTDVNIAVEMLTDAFLDKYDTAILISADSDLVGPVTAIKSMFPAKRVIVAFPPMRVSKELMKTADAYFHIGRAMFERSVFPDEVAKQDGFILLRPPNWSSHIDV